MIKKMRKKQLSVIILICLFSMNKMYAQTDRFRKMYENFKKEARADYNDFRQKANVSYAKFVKRAWEQFHALPAIPKPKDETVPPVFLTDEDKDKPIESSPVQIDDVVTPPTPEPQPVPIAPIKEQPMADRNVEFTYCGTACSIRFTNDGDFRLDGTDNEALAKAWVELSNGKYDNMLSDCLDLRAKLHLCDWAYLNMLMTFAEKYAGKGNLAIMLAAFAYCQSGYKMRIGRADGRLFLLFASKHVIYEMPYYEINGEKYYPLNCDVNQMEVCGASLPNEKPLSLYIPQRQLLSINKMPERTLTAERYEDMVFKISINKNIIDFYNTYPTSEVDDNVMTRWAIYANTLIEKNVAENLYPKMKERISGLSQQAAVNKILNWVQTAFVYEYDDKVWGGDRAFFPEETLYYPYCDCEDRSILFTRLVRDLLGLKCILVYYPGHLAAAVCFTDSVSGDYIMLDGDRFTICDPTYIGAPVGLTMPDMDNQRAKVILLSM